MGNKIKTYLVHQYYGGDGPVCLIFVDKSVCDNYLASHDRCDYHGSANLSELEIETFGELVDCVNGRFVDSYGMYLDD